MINRIALSRGIYTHKIPCYLVYKAKVIKSIISYIDASIAVVVKEVGSSFLILSHELWIINN